MAFGLFRKRLPESAAHAVEAGPAAAADAGVTMREIDGPIRVNGRHWGGFRTAYRL